MALGGGTFLTQNKILPGSYINFVSAARASANISDRGVVAMPLVADWGAEGEVIRIDGGDFLRNSLSITGYDYTHEQVQVFREIFKNAKTLYMYRLNSDTQKASNVCATAKYGGSRGNAIKISIQKNVDDESKFDVRTLLDDSTVDEQIVGSSAELLDNDFVVWKKDLELVETVATPMSGGTDGSGRTGENYQKFLDKIEGYSFNVLGCNTDDKKIIDLFVAFTKRMRDEVGVKFQTVVYRAENADYEGIINVENKLLDVDENVFGEFSLVYWVSGAAAGCAVNKSNTNKVYDGEYNVDTNYTQSQLEDAMQKGKFILHKVGEDVRVLSDINSFVSYTVDKNEDFGSNQTIRVLDQIGNDIAVTFNTKYLGKVQNNNAGRVALWNDIVTYHNELQILQAIENFAPADITVEQGDDKKSVTVNSAVTPVCAMEKLYMTVTVR